MHPTFKMIATIHMFLAAVIFSGCAGTSSQKVEYPTFRDYETVGKLMAQDMMSRKWINDFAQTNGNRLPVVAFFKIKQNTDTFVEPELLTERLTQTLVNSGQAEFRTEDDVRIAALAVIYDDERRDPAYKQAKAREAGVDFLLSGTISYNRTNKVDAGYLFTMKLVEVETSKVRWIFPQPVRLGIEALDKPASDTNGRY